jgi:hypothetical protein
VAGISVMPGRAEAMHSVFTTSFSPVTAGVNNTFKIQAKDIFSNIVEETNELFNYTLTNLATSEVTSSGIL